MPILRQSPPAPPPPAPPVVNVAVPPGFGRVAFGRPVLRSGAYAWALLGLVGVALVAARAATVLAVVVIPLVLALFPAAVLAPLVSRLTARRVPPSLAAFSVLLGSGLLLVGLVAALAPSVSAQLGGLGESLREGIDAVESFLASGPFGLAPVALSDLVARAREQITAGSEGLRASVVGALVVVTETIAGLLFGVVALFFYLKDGPRIAAWLRDLFPDSVRGDAAEVGTQAWQTVGAYIRGQIIIALVDAALIGLAIVLLGVPLALPLILLVVVGGLFPIVGAIVAGAVAVLVALATKGLTTALILLAVIVVVQQVEGDLLAPIVLGKATQLHPLATLAALTAGAVLLGVLGAFLAIPVTASLTRAGGYLRQRRREREHGDPSASGREPARGGSIALSDGA